MEYIFRQRKENFNDIIDSICRSTPERNEVHKKLADTVSRFKNQALAIDDELDANNVTVTELNNELLQIAEEHPEFKYYINSQKAQAGMKHKNRLVSFLQKSPKKLIPLPLVVVPSITYNLSIIITRNCIFIHYGMI